MNDQIIYPGDDDPVVVYMNAPHFVAYQRWLALNGLMLFPLPVTGPTAYGVTPSGDTLQRQASQR